MVGPFHLSDSEVSEQERDAALDLLGDVPAMSAARGL
jgi:hypothetical protein